MKMPEKDKSTRRFTAITSLRIVSDGHHDGYLQMQETEFEHDRNLDAIRIISSTWKRIGLGNEIPKVYSSMKEISEL